MEWISGNVYIRPMAFEEGGFKPGQVMAGHTHNFDHTTVFFCGSWKVRRWQPIVNAEGEPQKLNGEDAWQMTDDFEREGPFHVLIKANSKHEFTFLGPDSIVGQAWCVYSHRNPQGEVTVNATGWFPAYR